MLFRSRTSLIQILSLFAVLLLTSCTLVQTSQDYNFAKQPTVLSTFNWSAEFVSSGGIQKSDPLLHDRFLNNINSVLISKGYQISDSPDFWVQYSYEVVTEFQNDPSPELVVGVGSHSRYHGFGFSTGINRIEQVETGYLNIDFINGTTGQVFWRGRGSRPVRHHYTPQELSQVVNEMVVQVLAQYH